MTWHLSIPIVALVVMGVVRGGAGCTATVVVEDGTGSDGAGAAGADGSASSGQDYGGECAGILFKRQECPEHCEDKRVLCDPEEGPVEDSEDDYGLPPQLCPACQSCGEITSWRCTSGI